MNLYGVKKKHVNKKTKKQHKYTLFGKKLLQIYI